MFIRVNFVEDARYSWWYFYTIIIIIINIPLLIVWSWSVRMWTYLQSRVWTCLQSRVWTYLQSRMWTYLQSCKYFCTRLRWTQIVRASTNEAVELLTCSLRVPASNLVVFLILSKQTAGRHLRLIRPPIPSTSLPRTIRRYICVHNDK